MDVKATSIRSARAEDAEQLVQLHYDAVHAGARDDYASTVLDSWSPEPDQERYSWMRREIDHGHNQVLVMETADGTLVGFCMFSPEKGFIQAVYVAPDWFGRGIGRQLLRSAEGAIRESGTGLARLNASGNALGFYRSEGYVLAGPTTQSLSDGSRMDCYEMSKDLPVTSGRRE